MMVWPRQYITGRVLSKTVNIVVTLASWTNSFLVEIVVVCLRYIVIGARENKTETDPFKGLQKLLFLAIHCIHILPPRVSEMEARL
jgi:hypothetical protein